MLVILMVEVRRMSAASSIVLPEKREAVNCAWVVTKDDTFRTTISDDNIESIS